jgi:hypothetical protein
LSQTKHRICSLPPALTMLVSFSISLPHSHHASSIRSEPYDPYLPRAGSSSNPAGPSQPNPKTAAIQAQIDDTVGIMRENITKVAKRGEALDALQDKTGKFLSMTLVLLSLLCSVPATAKDASDHLS